MTVEEIGQVINVLPEGEHIILEDIDQKSYDIIRNAIFRAKKYGFEFCFKSLCNNRCYLEKMKEGNVEAHEERVKYKRKE